MARITLAFPDDQFCFSTLLTVRVTDINGAKHLGNDSMVSMLSEARARFLREHGVRDSDEGQVGTIVTDLVATYKAEAHAHDKLMFEVGVMDFNNYGGDIIFRVSRPADNRLIAMAKYGFVFYNYQSGQVVPMAEEFRSRFPLARQAA